MRRVKKLVATTGSYIKDGVEKKRYLTVGHTFEDDQGRRAHKIDSLPVGGEWNGWLSEYELDEQGRAPGQQSQQSQPAAAPAEDIPF